MSSRRTADGDGIDVTFIHGIENPAVKWFEIIEVVPSTNAAPAFDVALVDANTTEAIAYSLTPAVTDPDGDALTHSLDGVVPDGMTIDGSTGQIDWTPDFDGSGRYEITVSVTDGIHAPVSDTHSLDVGQTAPPSAGNVATGAVNDTSHPTVPGTAPDSVFTSPSRTRSRTWRAPQGHRRAQLRSTT